MHDDLAATVCFGIGADETREGRLPRTCRRISEPRPARSEALRHVKGVDEAYIYGSWAARHAGQAGQRPVADIDVLILGSPDRDRLYQALSAAESRLGRPVQATIREADWVNSGSGSFHESVTSRPMLKLTANGD